MKFSDDNPLLSAAEDMGGAALEAIRQRNEARQRVAELEERQQELLRTIIRLTNETPFPDEIKNWQEQRAALTAEIGTLRSSVRKLEAQNEDLRGRANGVDTGRLRDAIRALLKSEPTSGELRRALGELVR